MSTPMFLSHKPLKLLAGTAAAALLMGWAAGHRRTGGRSVALAAAGSGKRARAAARP